MLNVFIHGDMPEKIKRICKLYNVTEDGAVKLIKDTDKRRRTNYNFYTEQNGDGKELYIVIKQFTARI